MSVSQQVLNAAIFGPEIKEVEISGHEFNVKPVSIRIYRDELSVFGQLSHHLTGREDDQLFYSFRKKAGVVSPNFAEGMILSIQEGGLLKTLLGWRTAITFIANVFGFSADKYFELLVKVEGKLPNVDFDKDWEKSAKEFLEALSAAFAIPRYEKIPGLRLYANLAQSGTEKGISVGDDVADFRRIGFNDTVTSLDAFIPDNKLVRLFHHPNYSGPFIELGPGYHKITDLRIHNFDDVFSSAKWENV
jgi:hypothetical protein